MKDVGLMCYPGSSRKFRRHKKQVLRCAQDDCPIYDTRESAHGFRFLVAVGRSVSNAYYFFGSSTIS